MQILRPFKRAKPPDTWQALPQGDALQSEIQAVIDNWLPKLFGDYLLTVGALSSQLDTSASRIRHHFVMHRLSGEGIDVQAKMHEIPIDSNTIDVVVGAFSLDFTHKPHQTLRELHRILVGEGHLLLINFNPWSSWGIGKLFCGIGGRVPWNAHFYRPSRIKDWLQLLGFEVLESDYLYFGPPLDWIKESRFRRICAKRLRSLGAVNVLLIRKKVYQRIPLEPVWQKSRSLVVQFPSVTASRRTNLRS